MKREIIILLIVIVLFLVGCAKEEDVSSLNEYDMVYWEEKEDCQKFF